jgi:hypothetical protein
MQAARPNYVRKSQANVRGERVLQSRIQSLWGVVTCARGGSVGSTHYLGSQYYKYSQSPLSPVSLASILVPTQGPMVPPSSLFLAKVGLMEFIEMDGGHGA